MYFRRKTSAGRAYLQIVESCRDGDQVRQQVIATLGRFDELQASGQLERLVRSGARFRCSPAGRGTGNSRIVLRAALRATRVRPWTKVMIAFHTSSFASRKLLWMRSSPPL